MERRLTMRHRYMDRCTVGHLLPFTLTFNLSTSELSILSPIISLISANQLRAPIRRGETNDNVSDQLIKIGDEI
jgi:hypothetical protein